MTGLIESILRMGEDLFLPWGVYGLAIVSFTEAIFLPLPPDVLLIPLVLLDPSNALLYGAAATLTSTLGGLAGYYLGLKGGRPVVLKLTGGKGVGQIEHYFKRYGVLAVGLAAFTPIPFKVFTISSGVFNLRNIRGFIAASLLGRGGRFMTESALLSQYGDEIIKLIDSFFIQITIVTIAAVAVLVIVGRRA